MENSTAAKIFNKYVNTSVTLYSSGINSNYTGFIKDIINGRAIVVTCAHCILFEEGTNNSIIQPAYPICGSFNGVTSKGSSRKKNVNVSLGVLGMDVSSDIAVLFTYLPCEVNAEKNILFGFEFCKDNRILKWGDSINFTRGNNVYSIGYSYANGLDMYSGTCTNNNFIYNPDDASYSNLRDQFLTSLNVETGSSGAAVLSNKGKILGIIAWKKNTGNNYIGGASQFTLSASYTKILKLNPVKNISGFYEGQNFNGKTGSGWTGLLSFQYLNSKSAIELLQQYPEYVGSKRIQKAEGIVLTGIAPDTSYGVEKVPLNHALNLNTNTIEPILPFDIVLKVNNQEVSYFGSNQQIGSAVYYDVNTIVLLNIFRPSNGKYYNFKVIPVAYPSQLEYVSIDSSITLISTNIQLKLTIEVISNRTQFKFSFTDTNGIVKTWYSLYTSALNTIFSSTTYIYIDVQKNVAASPYTDYYTITPINTNALNNGTRIFGTSLV